MSQVLCARCWEDTEDKNRTKSLSSWSLQSDGGVKTVNKFKRGLQSMLIEMSVTEKTKQKRGNSGGEAGPVSNWMVREGHPEKVTWKQRPAGGKVVRWPLK